ncbi:MAG: CAP domain-containing protein, partial [Actinomycetota bacterium]|nr:CAP domain-containing protein [Actinomycetota bacterium]
WTGPSGTSEDAIAADILERMNHERVARGRRPLLWDVGLAETAEAWSATMPSIGFRHSDVDATMASIGGLDRMAENIYRGSLSYADAGSAHLGFMESAEHRHTLLASAYTTAAVGAHCDASGQLWVAVHFAAPDGHAPTGTRVPTSAGPVAAPDQHGSSCTS